MNVPTLARLLVTAALFGATLSPLCAAETLVYFGTFSKGPGKGIFVSKLNASTGALSQPEVAAEIPSPGFLAIHPNGRLLYAVGELLQPSEKPGGGVSALSVDRDSGKLTLLNQQTSGGKGPCHISVDRKGRHALVANYGGGSAAVLRIESDGRLGEQTAFVQHTGSSVNPQRQQGPHAHSINLDKANRFAFVADLGTDKIMIYRFDDALGTLAPNNPPFASLHPGAGPRHFAFSPNGRFAYAINELQCTVTAFKYDPKHGALTEIHTVSTLPDGMEVRQGFSTAEVRVHPSGTFVYGSNRGHDTIAVFSVDWRSGRLKLIQNEPTQGRIPRNFGIDPTGRWLLAANQDSDSVVVFQIDRKTGKLSPTGQTISVPRPVCVKFLAR